MKSTGEQIMCDFLEVFLEGQEYIDNYRPDWLTNPRTGQILEIDRYYPKLRTGYEYQGEQHLRQVDGFENINYRHDLDNLKKRLAHASGVEIVRVEPVELQIHCMFHKAKRAYRHLDKLRKKEGQSLKGMRRMTSRHKKEMSNSLYKAKCKELSKRAAAYRKWLEETYGDQVGIHRKKTRIRRAKMAIHKTPA